MSWIHTLNPIHPRLSFVKYQPKAPGPEPRASLESKLLLLLFLALPRSLLLAVAQQGFLGIGGTRSQGRVAWVIVVKGKNTSRATTNPNNTRPGD